MVTVSLFKSMITFSVSGASRSRVLKNVEGLNASSSIVSKAFCTLVSSKSMGLIDDADTVDVDAAVCRDVVSELGALVVRWDSDLDFDFRES